MNVFIYFILVNSFLAKKESLSFEENKKETISKSSTNIVVELNNKPEKKIVIKRLDKELKPTVTSRSKTPVRISNNSNLSSAKSKFAKDTISDNLKTIERSRTPILEKEKKRENNLNRSVIVEGNRKKLDKIGEKDNYVGNNKHSFSNLADKSTPIKKDEKKMVAFGLTTKVPYDSEKEKFGSTHAEKKSSIHHEKKGSQNNSVILTSSVDKSADRDARKSSVVKNSDLNTKNLSTSTFTTKKENVKSSKETIEPLPEKNNKTSSKVITDVQRGENKTEKIEKLEPITVSKKESKIDKEKVSAIKNTEIDKKPSTKVEKVVETKSPNIEKKSSTNIEKINEASPTIEKKSSTKIEKIVEVSPKVEKKSSTKIEKIVGVSPKVEKKSSTKIEKIVEASPKNEKRPSKIEKIAEVKNPEIEKRPSKIEKIAEVKNPEIEKSPSIKVVSNIENTNEIIENTKPVETLELVEQIKKEETVENVSPVIKIDVTSSKIN
jgi:hypothetical protein